MGGKENGKEERGDEVKGTLANFWLRPWLLLC